VYGEAGYGGHNKDDAMNFGGANVWVNSITPSNFDVKNGYAHMKFKGKDWYLVRRKSQPSGGWHKVNDQAQGTAAYGKNCANPRGNCDFSSQYKSFDWKNMLMASGDLKMWVTMPKSTVDSFTKINCNNCILKLTGSSGSKSARQYMRQGAREDPWISAGNHPTHIVYGENGYNGHNSDDALNFGGANVVRISSRPSWSSLRDLLSYFTPPHMPFHRVALRLFARARAALCHLALLVSHRCDTNWRPICFARTVG
jgi:hypothetical protein